MGSENTPAPQHRRRCNGRCWFEGASCQHQVLSCNLAANCGGSLSGNEKGERVCECLLSLMLISYLIATCVCCSIRSSCWQQRPLCFHYFTDGYQGADRLSPQIESLATAGVVIWNPRMHGLLTHCSSERECSRNNWTFKFTFHGPT